MPTPFDSWARDWRLPPEALADLRQRLVRQQVEGNPCAGFDEAWVQGQIRLAAPKKGWMLWRNNVGALVDKRGIPVRYGLANDTKAMNERIKSADLVGIRPRVVTQQDVGATIGQFVSIEVKHPGWKWSGDQHEIAQLKWATLVASLGGHARITNTPELQ